MKNIAAPVKASKSVKISKTSKTTSAVKRTRKLLASSAKHRTVVIHRTFAEAIDGEKGMPIFFVAEDGEVQSLKGILTQHNARP